MSLLSRTLQPRHLSIFGSKPVLLAMCLLAACTFLLFYINYQYEIERALESVQGKFSERLTALDRAVSATETSLDIMRNWAESYLATAGEQSAPSPLLIMLQYHKKGDYFELSGNEKQSGKNPLGNILGVGPISGRSNLFQKELNLAAGLLPLLRASQEESAVILQNYYFSDQKISSSYPYMPVSVIIANAAPGGTLEDAFDTFYEPHAGLHTNPEGKGYWTEVYHDRSGHGLMVTYATPLYDGDRLVGLLAADITLGFLKRFAEQFDGPPGRLILATNHERVLIDSETSLKMTAANIPVLHDRLPTALKKNSSEILRGDMAGVSSTNGYYILARKLESAPWTFIHILNEDDLSNYLSLSRATFGITVAVLTFFLVSAYFAVRQKKAEKELRRYESIVATSHDLMSLIDRDYVYQAVNDSYLNAHEKKRDEIIGHSVEELLGKETFKKTVKEKLDQCLSGQKVHYQSWFNFPDSGQRYMDVAYYPFYDERNQIAGAVVNSRDITETKFLEDQLIQAQKMEAIGTLAGGIAHDFNNILSAIIGYTELSLPDLKNQPLLEGNLLKVLKAGERARDLAKQILTFSRQSEQEFIPIQIKPVARESLNLLRASIPKTIEIRKNINNDATVLADPTQIHQVIINLCTNASHAMLESGGVLEVSLTNVTLESDFIAQHPEINAGKYLRIEVSDTGCGMSKEIMDRAFNPFFTTKERGKGTGMGLSVVHGIVNSHGGAISVSSEPGKGSVFNVFLPVVENDKILAMDAEEPIPTGNERILFIDDEEILAEMCKEMLEQLGYDVTATTSSIEALETFRANADKYDLIITDMTMPLMTGEKLAKEIMNIRPDIPIVICTGYSELISEESARAMGIKEYAMKPLVKRDLARIIRKALEPN